MTIDRDTKLGQLAIARGLVDLGTLLRCVVRSGSSKASLSDVLVGGGHLDGGQVRELESQIRSCNAAELQQEFDDGETMVLSSILSASSTRGQPTKSVREIGDTLDKRRATNSAGEAAAASPFDRLRLRRDERYEFVDELGRGGMGQVMLAHDLTLHRDIAFKTLLPAADGVDDARQRLLQEAQVTGILEHPSIIPIYDLGALANDEPFYTMRVVRERSLEQVIGDMQRDDDRDHSLTQLISMVRQVCLAIHYAHDRGVVHRDLKPENVLIGAYGEVFVIDWGVAKVLEVGLDALSMVETVEEEAGTLVGTPRYMAPEQALGEHQRIGTHTDVYALGAILYEVLTLTPVFSADRVLSLLFKVVEEDAQPPTSRAPERNIPQELEDIALKALAKAPEDRYASAEAMADDLELFMEGVKERQRRRKMAQQAVDEAAKVRQRYENARQHHASMLGKARQTRIDIPSWADYERRETLWELEQRAQDLQVEIERLFGETTRLYGQALVHLPEMSEARHRLAELYWQRLREAEMADDQGQATYFESLVRQYNDGWYDDLLQGRAHLSVLADDGVADVTVYKFVEVNRRLTEKKLAELGQTPILGAELQHGSYVLEIDHRHGTRQVPVKLERLADKQITLTLDFDQRVPDDFSVISAGEFLSGELQAHDLDGHLQFVDDFAIQTYPVTCAQYLEFLNALAAHDLDDAREHAPRLEEGASYFPVDDDGRFYLPTDDAEGDAWGPNWPICMVSYHDALRYARWRGQRDGVDYRLPSSGEWEKAARGVDGRLYPWGNYFDPSFCHMRDSERGKPMPVSVDKYKFDRSPYGVRDMAGNVVEWTSTPGATDSNRRVVQGAAFGSVELMCRLDWHMDGRERFRHAYRGFRLAMSLQ